MMRWYFFSVFTLCTCFGRAQIITTFAGGGTSGSGDGGAATVATLSDPCSGIFDKYGNYYFTEGLGGNRLRKIDIAGTITTIAGTGVAGFSGDGGQATSAKLKSPTTVILDTSGNIFILDFENVRIRKIDATTHVISTIAGNGIIASTGNGGPATAASLGSPQNICLDKLGNLYVSEGSGMHVRKINTTGIISNFVGNGMMGYSGNGSKADTAAVGTLTGVCTDNDGNLYVASDANSRVFKVNATGIITTVAGTATGYTFNGDEIPATSANIDPAFINFDKYGHLFIAEVHNYRVRMVDKNGIIHTVAGIGTPGFSGDGGVATAAQLKFPSGIAFDSCDNLYIPEANNNRIRKVTYDKCNYLSVAAVAQAATTIYPTPITDALYIDNVAQKSKYRLYNLVGTVVNEGILYKGNNSIMLQGLPSGIYLLALAGEDGSRVVQRVVKE